VAATAAATVAVVADQASKMAVRLRLPSCFASPAALCAHIRLGPVWILRAANRGGALGAAKGSILWPALAGMAIVALLLLGRTGRGHLGRAGAIGAGMLLGGSFGNLIDRVLLAGVTDFISIRSSALGYVTINVADLFAIVGTILLAWSLARRWGGDRPPFRSAGA
jgi:signal peptidase II